MAMIKWEKDLYEKFQNTVEFVISLKPDEAQMNCELIDDDIDAGELTCNVQFFDNKKGMILFRVLAWSSSNCMDKLELFYHQSHDADPKVAAQILLALMEEYGEYLQAIKSEFPVSFKWTLFPCESSKKGT